MHAMESANAPVLAEYPHHAGDAEDFSNSLMPSYSAPQPQKRGLEVALIVVGMLLPLLTQVGHAHAHGV
jgi:hypothetical protein